MGKFVVVVLSCVVLGCANIHNGNFEKDEKGKETVKGGLKVSALENTSLSSKHFLPMDFTIENTTDEWIVIESAKLTFNDQATTANFIVPVGRDLLAWSDAARQNAAISSYNTALALSAVTLAGAAVAGGSSDKNVAQAGALGAVGAGTALTAVEISEYKGKLEKARVVPETHLYGDAFSIPPGLHAKKWVVFSVKEPLKIPYVREATLSLKLKGKEEINYKIPFRRTMLISPFQSGHPELDRRKK